MQFVRWIPIILVILLTVLIPSVPVVGGVDDSKTGNNLDFHPQPSIATFNYSTVEVQYTTIGDEITDLTIYFDVHMANSTRVTIFLLLTDDNVTVHDIFNSTRYLDRTVPTSSYLLEKGENRVQLQVSGANLYITKLQQLVDIQLLFGYPEDMDYKIEISDPITNFIMDYTQFVKPAVLIDQESIHFTYYNSSGEEVNTSCECIRVIEISYNFTLTRQVDSLYLFDSLILWNSSNSATVELVPGDDGEYDKFRDLQVGQTTNTSSRHILDRELKYSSELTSYSYAEAINYEQGMQVEEERTRTITIGDDTIHSNTLLPLNYSVTVSDNPEVYYNSLGEIEWLDYHFNSTSDGGVLDEYSIHMDNRRITTQRASSGPLITSTVSVPVFHPNFSNGTMDLSFRFNYNILGDEYLVRYSTNRTVVYNTEELAQYPFSNVVFDYTPNYVSDGKSVSSIDFSVEFDLDYIPRGTDYIGLGIGFGIPTYNEEFDIEYLNSYSTFIPYQPVVGTTTIDSSVTYEEISWMDDTVGNEYGNITLMLETYFTFSGDNSIAFFNEEFYQTTEFRVENFVEEEVSSSISSSSENLDETSSTAREGEILQEESPLDAPSFVLVLGSTFLILILRRTAHK